MVFVKLVIFNMINCSFSFINYSMNHLTLNNLYSLFHFFLLDVKTKINATLHSPTGWLSHRRVCNWRGSPGSAQRRVKAANKQNDVTS